MAPWKKLVIFAVLAAMPIEVLNFMVAGAMFDPGPADPRWRWKLISFEWAFLHMPGLLLLPFFERVSGCMQLNIPGNCGHVDAFAIFGIGYLDTVLLLLLLIFGFRWLRWLIQPGALS